MTGNTPFLGREAVLQYLDGDFRIIRGGEFVRCAVTDQPIALADLRYWNVDLQEAYVDAETAIRRHRELKAASRASGGA